eukprot:3392179-Prymnesium_polylepis.1
MSCVADKRGGNRAIQADVDEVLRTVTRGTAKHRGDARMRLSSDGGRTLGRKPTHRESNQARL